jgi:gliding motility-associated-like protein
MNHPLLPHATARLHSDAFVNGVELPTHRTADKLSTALIRSIFVLILQALSVSSFAQGNTAPLITGQNPLSTRENKNIEVLLTDLQVSDPDNVYPDDFTLTLSPGENYEVDKNKVIPAQGFTGTLSVPASVNDGENDSPLYNLGITVTGETQNVKPVITGQLPLSVEQGQPLTVAFTDLVVDDPDNVYPTGFSMTLQAGANYNVSRQTITPSADFTGTLTVPVTVSDGQDSSDPFNLSITVTAAPPVNEKPVITGQRSLTTEEDTPLTIQFADLTVTDGDDTYPTGFTLTVQAGTNYSVSGATITPSPGFSGTLTVPVTVNDGEESSDPFNLSVSVTEAEPVNQKPVITGQTPVAIEENTPFTIGLSHLTVTDPDNVYPTDFTLAVGAGTNYTVNGQTVTPATDFTGTLSIPVTVSDGEAVSDPFTFVITVSPKTPPPNTKPTITGQVPLSIENTESITITLAHLIVTDPDNDYPQDFTLKILSGTNYTVSGTTVTPVGGFTGTLSVRVVVNDGTDDSDPFNLQIAVTAPPVNQAPVITGQQELTTFKNTPLTLRLTHLIVSDPDNTYPQDFTLTVSAGTNYTVQGTTITPANEFIGVLTVPVTVNDGSTNSATFNVKISVINRDELRITGQKQITIREDSTFTLLPSHLEVNDPSGLYPDGYAIVIEAGDNYTSTGATVTPVRDFSGTIEIPVSVTNGTQTSTSFRVVVSVTPVNDPPVLENPSDLPTSYAPGAPAVLVSREVEVTDSDNETLAYAEVSVDPADFDSGKDVLSATSSENIRAVFDPATGTLVLLGTGTVGEYQSVLRSVTYEFRGDTVPASRERSISFRVNDGDSFSEAETRRVVFEEKITLDVPNVFSPNDDNKNDTWLISDQDVGDNATAVVRVFDQRGTVVYESGSINEAWDGRYKGENLPSGVYFYSIEVNSPANNVSQRGTLTILR